jgi:hypothetical protein
VPDADHRAARKFSPVKFAVAVAVLVICLVTVSCRKDFGDGADGVLMAGTTIEEVLKRNNERLMSVPGVVGTGIGRCDGKPCIRVYVVKKTPELEKKILSAIEGYPVVVEETGPIRPLDR